MFESSKTYLIVYLPAIANINAKPLRRDYITAFTLFYDIPYPQKVATPQ
jgi:hypothetical protein